MIMYEIHCAPSRIETHTDVRLAFEPKGWQLEYRPELRQALRALEAVPGEVLVAELITDDDRFFDVENVLLYNVGASSFRHLTTEGIVFRRVTGRSAAATYTATYEVAIAPDWFAGREPVAHWDFEMNRLSSSTKTHEAWWAMRTGRIEVVGDAVGVFGLDLLVTPPAGRVANVAGFAKPLLDGVVCALHKEEGTISPEATAWLANDLRITEREVAKGLAGPAAPLGAVRLVRATSAGVQWNPADHLCHEVRIRVEAPTGDAWSVAGTLVEPPLQ